jgi:hypothetical protein
MQQPSVNGRLHDVIGKCTPVAAGHALFAGIVTVSALMSSS